MRSKQSHDLATYRCFVLLFGWSTTVIFEVLRKTRAIMSSGADGFSSTGTHIDPQWSAHATGGVSIPYGPEPMDPGAALAAYL